MTTLAETTRTAVGDGFEPVPGYLNAATMGLPSRRTATAMRDAVDQWQLGQAGPLGYDALVTRARSLYAQLVHVPAGAVAVGSQTSVSVGAVAASLPDGARVVCVEGDFSSVVHPFLVQAARGVHVRQVPLERLAEAVADADRHGGVDVVAFSLAQSADGRLADAPAVLAAARDADALTLCDTTQAAGWLDVDAGAYDLTICSAYKWLCCPRGVAFTTCSARALETVRPVAAGWYAGESVWDSCYGPDMRLAGDARRLDVSPAWLSWAGAVPALELFTALPADRLRRHGADLADRLRAGLGLAPQARPVLALDDPDGRLAGRLADAGCVVAGRAGRARLAFHLWNDEDDVDRALAALVG